MAFNKKRYWTAYTDLQRHIGIPIVETTISRWGHITDYKMFSDVVVTLTIEIEARKVDALYADLKAVVELDECPPLQSDSEMEIQIYLNMTFVKGTGNMKHEVPAVPG